jgi:hypothetical protein
VVARLRDRDLLPRWVHQANSAGILSGRVASELVRSALPYGLSPSDNFPSMPASVRCWRCVARLVDGRFAAGDGVAYG